MNLLRLALDLWRCRRAVDLADLLHLALTVPRATARPWALAVHRLNLLRLALDLWRCRRAVDLADLLHLALTVHKTSGPAALGHPLRLALTVREARRCGPEGESATVHEGESATVHEGDGEALV